jgi:hypothetical protein
MYVERSFGETWRREERRSGKRRRGKGSSAKHELVNINVYQTARQRPESAGTAVFERCDAMPDERPSFVFVPQAI